eukprot:11857588-Heterocapsa_arctica.AAC.1
MKKLAAAASKALNDGSYGAKEMAESDKEHTEDDQSGEWKKARRGKSKRGKRAENYNLLVEQFTARLAENEHAQTGAGSIGPCSAAVDMARDILDPRVEVIQRVS